MLKEVYGNNPVSHAQVFEWYKWLSEDQEQVEDSQHPHWPCILKTQENVEKTMLII